MSRADADELLLRNGRVRDHKLLCLARSGQRVALQLRPIQVGNDASRSMDQRR